MKTIMIIISTILVSLSLSVSGDSGVIPFESNVKIFEPTQKALIAWNGEEEILLLSTDLSASEPTKALEVIPLPSEPEVKKGDLESFKMAVEIINEKQKKIEVFSAESYGAGGGFGGFGAEPPGEITYKADIGAHDITVVRVVNSEGFVKWVEDYLKKQDVKNPKIPEPLKEVVEEYLDEGFKWFVFNVVELTDVVNSKEAIQYRFKSSRFFYPLKIIRVESGDTTVEIIALTPRLLSKSEGIPSSRIKLKHEPVELTRRELRAISNEMANLMNNRSGMMLRIWTITGKLSEFKEDVVATW